MVHIVNQPLLRSEQIYLGKAEMKSRGSPGFLARGGR